MTASKSIPAGALALALLAAPGWSMDDDLAVVRRAVAASRPAPPRPAPTRRLESRAAAAPRWLKVRVVDKVSGRTRVTVNMPLALVRAVGSGWPEIRWRCPSVEGREPESRCSFKVAEILAALEAGEELAEIDDEKELVKVWVE